MRKPGNKTSQQQDPIIGRHRRTNITHNHQCHQNQQNLLQRTLAGQKQHGRTKTDTQRIRRDEMTGHGNADFQISSHIGQNTHHCKFGNSQPQCTECQCNKTLLHTLKNNLYFLPGAKIMTLHSPNKKDTELFSVSFFIFYLISIVYPPLKTSPGAKCCIQSLSLYSPL